MRPLHLDFVVRPNLWAWVGSALVIFPILLLLHQGYVYRNLSVSLNAWEKKWQSFQKEKKREPATKDNPQWMKIQAELKSANGVINHISMPWGALFSNIEATVNEQVTLLSVEPDIEKQELRITGEAKDLMIMLEYMKRVRAVFQEAHLVSHQIQVQDPQRPVRFLITARWNINEM